MEGFIKCCAPEGTESMATRSSEPERTLWVLFTLFHAIKAFSKVYTLLRCNLKSHPEPENDNIVSPMPYSFTGRGKRSSYELNK